MEKLNKRGYFLIKSYQIISLLNYLGKGVEKLVVEQLAQFCETNWKLHKGQIDTKKNLSAIYVTAMLVEKIQDK